MSTQKVSSHAWCINPQTWECGEEYTVDLSMLIIMHRLRTIFYYLPLQPPERSLRNAFCVHQCKTLFPADDKSYEMYIMSLLAMLSTIFFSSETKANTARKMEFSCSMALSCITLGTPLFPGRHRIYRPRKGRKCKHMQFLCGMWILRRVMCREWDDVGAKNAQRRGKFLCETFALLRVFCTMAAAYKSILSDAFFMYTSGTCSGQKEERRMLGCVAQASDINSQAYMCACYLGC